MSGSVEDLASEAFIESLLDGVRAASATSRRDVQYLTEEVLPVLIPAVVHLLKARADNLRRRREDEDSALPIQPMDHLAKYLYRHNPRHHEPSAQTAELQALARRLARK